MAFEEAQRGSWIRTAYLGYLTIGLISTLFGPLLVGFQQALGLSHTQAGLFVTSQFVGSMLGTLVGGAASDRYGRRPLLALAAGLVVAGALGVAFLPSYPLLLGAFLLLGMGSGAINGSANALVSDLAARQRAAALNRLNVNFSMGALLGPFLVARLFAAGLSPVRPLAYGLVAGLGLLFGLRCLAHPPLPLAAGLSESQAGEAAGGSRLRQLLTDGTLWLMGAVLMIYVALESSVATWWPAYLQEHLQATEAAGGDVVTAFFVAVVAGRWITSVVVDRWGALRTLQVEALLAALLFPLALAGGSLAGAGSIALTGLAAAGLFATTLALAADRHPDQSGTLSGLLIAMASAGSSLFPLWIGFAGDRWGLRAGLLTLEGLLILLVLISRLLGRQLHGRPVGGRHGQGR